MSALAAMQSLRGARTALPGHDGAAADENADIRAALARLAPTFSFDRAMRGEGARLIAVREAGVLHGFVIMAAGAMKFYYAADAQTARILMAQFETAPVSRQ